MTKKEQIKDFKKEIEALKNVADAEEYAKQLAHLFLGNGLSLQTILLMAIDFGQQQSKLIPVERNAGWHSASERPLPATGKKIIVYYKDADGVSCSHTSFLTNLYEWYGVPAYVQDNLIWCYPPVVE